MEFNTLCLILCIAALVLCAVFFAAGILYRKKVAEKQIGSAEEEAKRIINEAIKGGESKKREMLLEAKEEIHRSRSEYERDILPSGAACPTPDRCQIAWFTHLSDRSITDSPNKVNNI